MGRQVYPEACWVVNEYGQQMIYTPDGKLLGVILMTRVTDEADELPVALVKMIVNIGTKEEMIEAIEKQKKTNA